MDDFSLVQPIADEEEEDQPTAETDSKEADELWEEIVNNVVVYY